MKLPYKIKNIESVPEAVRSFYVKTDDGDYVLEVDGVADKDKLNEFREKNIQLMKEAEKFKDLNPEKYAELIELQRQRQEKELIDKGELDKVIESRVLAMKKEHESTVNTLTQQASQMTRQLESLLIDNTVRTTATKIGIRPEAVDDLLLRAKTVFSIKDGKVTALDNDQKIQYGKDGTTPLSIEEWASNLKPLAPHLYLDSIGGGASNGHAKGGSSNNNLKGVSKISNALDGNNFD